MPPMAGTADIPHGQSGGGDPARYLRSDGRGFGVVAEPELQRIVAYWCSKRGGRSMPCRSDIDPVDIPWALSRFFLVDYERDTRTFRDRIAGSEVEDVVRRFTGSVSMRGVTLQDMLPAGSLRIVQDRWRPLAENGDIVYMRGLVYLAAERVPVGARILLPLSDRDDGLTTGLIGFTVCEWFLSDELVPPPGLDIYRIPISEVTAAPG